MGFDFINKLEEQKKPNPPKIKSKNGLITFFSKYKFGVATVISLALATNLLSLVLPRVASKAINNWFNGIYKSSDFIMVYGGLIALMFLIGFVQILISNTVTEQVAAEIRRRFIAKVSNLSFSYINQVTTGRLLTNLTNDVESVKILINQGLVMAFSAVVLLIGSAVSMLSLNFKLGVIVISIIPILFVAFAIIFSKIGKYFNTAQEILDKTNRVINEAIVGAGIIRVLNAGKYEMEKYTEVNTAGRDIGIKITNGFAALIPIITILANIAVLSVVYVGGTGVMDFIGSGGEKGLNPGDFSAFFTYVGTFIFPIILLGFIGSIIGRSLTSFKRIQEILDSDQIEKYGDLKKEIKGKIELKNISLELANKSVLKDISLNIKPGTRNAIIGPTAAGKTQIFYLITGLMQPKEGEILVDDEKIGNFDPNSFYSQIGMVFQDSIIFNTTVRENILFKGDLGEESLRKAIETAELDEFVKSQEKGLDTLISERGASLSGGQKQRLTLARALVLNPKILLLDDFTARVDIRTEKSIINNLKKNYPDLTLISITQKIESIKDYDQIILIMEGELIAKGTHKELMKSSFEYQQIYNSQKSTEE